MSKNVYVFLAEGFEEVEAIGTIDLLRRAGLPTHIVAVGLEPNVTGAHGIAIHADLSISEVYSDDVLALVLPGGLPGVTNLDASQRLHQLIREAHQDGKLLCAICAAPSVFGGADLLEGNEAPVVKSGHFITAKSAGYTFDFALEIITALAGEEKAKEVASGIIYTRH